jgi:hypothetical protein
MERVHGSNPELVPYISTDIFNEFFVKEDRVCSISYICLFISPSIFCLTTLLALQT